MKLKENKIELKENDGTQLFVYTFQVITSFICQIQIHSPFKHMASINLTKDQTQLLCNKLNELLEKEMPELSKFSIYSITEYYDENGKYIIQLNTNFGTFILDEEASSKLRNKFNELPKSKWKTMY